MTDLLLAISCSVAIGAIFKHAGRRGMDRAALLTVNYAAAAGVAVALLSLDQQAASECLALSGPLVALGVGTGALLIFGFFMLSLATDVAGMSLAIGVMRVSVVLPVLASWLVWDEAMSVAKGVGLVLAGAAFFMVARREQAAPRHVSPAKAAAQPRVFGVLALLFVAGGAVDLSMKAFDELFASENSRVLFLLMTFGVALALGLSVVLWRGVRRGAWPRAGTLGWGVLLGVINYGSIAFVLRALRDLPGTVVFPVNNVAIVVLAAFVGVLGWGERLSRLNQAGLALAALALVLLNL